MSSLTELDVITCLKNSLFRLRIVQDNRCDCNMGVEEVEHVFWQCSKFEKERKIMTKNLHKIRGYGPFSIVAMLAEMDNKVINVLTTYIERININI